MWTEVESTKKDNKRELKLSGAFVSERIDANGLDPSIFELTMLNLLNISDTSLKILPNEIAQLINLQTILLFGNELESLPKSIGTLEKLKVFDFSRNKLKSIPDEIVQLKHLTAINLSANAITEFPSLDSCSNLAVLDLSNNQLQDFPNICNDGLCNLSEINFKGNQIKMIPNEITTLVSLKHLNLSSNLIKTVPKSVATMSKLKDLLLEDNPIADKRLYKLIQQCRTKQILDYVKQHGTDPPPVSAAANGGANNGVSAAGGGGGGGDGKSSKSRKQKQNKVDKLQPINRIIVQRHTDDSLKLIFMDQVKDVRQYILCCIVRNINLENGNFKKFLQIQTKLHESVCGKRELSTIATHDLNKVKGGWIRYTARNPKLLEILPLGKQKKVSAQKLYDNLKAEAEALRKEKKRNVYSGIHKYLYLLDKLDTFACVEDGEGNVISLPPLTNGDLTKISAETKNVLIEVTSSSSIKDCRDTIQELLREMLMAGFGVPQEPIEPVDAADDTNSFTNQLIVQQIKTTDLDGNLKAVYPSKSDLQFDENLLILVNRE